MVFETSHLLSPYMYYSNSHILPEKYANLNTTLTILCGYGILVIVLHPFINEGEIMMRILHLLIPLVVYISITSAISILIRKSFGRVIPLTLCGSALIMYISQILFSTFNPGFYGILALAAASVIYIIFSIVKKNSNVQLGFSAGLVAFLAIYLVACYLLLGKQLADWDELTHWGMMVKESLRLDKFYVVPESRLMWHKEYPPFPCLLEVFWCKLYGYSASHATIPLHVLTLSLIVPVTVEKVMEGFDAKSGLFFKSGGVDGGDDRGVDGGDGRNARTVLAHVCMAAFVAFLVDVLAILTEYMYDLWPQHIINSMLPDVLLAFMFAYMIITIINWDHKEIFSIVSITIIGSSLLLTKQVGLAFIMVAVFCLIVREIAYRRDEKTTGLRFLLSFVIMMVIMLTAYMSWNMYKGKYISEETTDRSSGQFNLSQLSISEYFKAFSSNSDELKHETLTHYFKSLIKTPISNCQGIQVSYALAFIIVIAALIILYVYVSRKYNDIGKNNGNDKNNTGYKADGHILSKSDFIALLLSFIVGTAGYAFMMSMLYLFCFPENEMRELAGFTRYMSSYVIGELMILFYLMFSVIRGRTFYSKIWGIVVITLLSYLLLLPNHKGHYMPQAWTETNYIYYKQFADTLEQQVPKDSKVFIIYDKEQTPHPRWYDPMQMFVQYYNNEIEICNENNNAFILDYSNKKKVKSVKNTFKKCDYLYMINTNDELNRAFSKYNDGEKFKDNTIYKIEKDDGLRFEEVE